MARSRRSAALLIAVAVALAAPPAASAAWPGLNGRVAVTQDPRTRDLWAFARDGTSTQLTFTANQEQQSSWAPDGRRIAFKRSDEVWVRDVTTDDPPLRLTRKAVSTENNTQPTWSPDGRSIVFRTNRTDPSENIADVWIMDANGANQRPLIAQDGDERYPALSPDGTLLAYTSNEGAGADLWLANADGTGAHMLFDSGRFDSAPAWSPDGTKLAFEIHDPLVSSFDGDIFVIDVHTGVVTQLTRDPTGAPVHDEGPAWSPDGTMIAFTSARSDPLGDIWIMNGDGSDPRRLTDNVILDESPDWQPIPFAVGSPDRPARPCGDPVAAAGRRLLDRRRQDALSQGARDRRALAAVPSARQPVHMHEHAALVRPASRRVRAPARAEGHRLRVAIGSDRLGRP